MKNIFKFLIAILMVSGATSCSDDYLDVNQSPNDPTSENLDPSLTLGAALARPPITLFTTGSTLGAMMTNQWGGDINAYAAPFTDEFRLVVTNTFYNALWDNTYLRLNTNESILNYQDSGFENHQAIARINKAMYFQYLVDLYGDVPYSEALKQGGDLTPAYDDAKTIYRDLIVQLDLAIAQLKDSNSTASPVGAEDIAYGGDLSQWVKVANTIKLRILIRQSGLAGTDGETQSYLAAQFAALEKNFISENFSLQPGYVNALNQQNPIYSSFGFDAAAVASQNQRSIVASFYFAEFLKGGTTENGISTGLLDPRVSQLFQPVEGEVLGVVQGDINDNTPDALSHIGPGIVKASSQDFYLITAAESYFLQSEAVFRNFYSGDAKSLFQQGITKAFENVNAEGAAAYIAASDNINLIGWNGSSNKLEAIITQKWIALNAQNGVETFIEYNRTGFPNVPLSLVAEKPNKPYRLLYPASEYTANSANVPAQSANDAFTKKIFWDVN